MLEFIRKRTGSIVVKLLLGLLILAFGLWGITDVFMAATRKPAAVVGDEKISAQDFHYAYRDAQQRMMVATKGKLSIQDMIRLKLPEQVLENLIQERLAEQFVRKLDLTVSDAFIQTKMQQIPQFTTKGRYDPNKFVQYLRAVGLSERQFLTNLRSGLVKQQAQVPMISGVELPFAYKKFLYKRLMQKHTFAVARIPINSVKTDKIPTDNELKSFYNKNTSMFKQPELRSISVITLLNSDFIANIKVNEQQIKDEYERRTEEFTSEERRSIIVVKLESFEEAEKIRKVAFGDSLEKIATKEKLKLEKFTNKAAAEMPELYANIGFNIGEGDISKPEEGISGFLLIQTTAIKAPKLAKFEEVREQLALEIKNDKARKDLQTAMNELEDAISSGMQFTEVAKKFPTAKLIEADSVSSTGLNQDDKLEFEVIPEEMRSSMLTQAFEIEEGQETSTIETDAGAVIATVNKIIPSQVPDFGATKSKVLKLWQYNANYGAANKLAEEISKKSKSLEAFKAAIKSNNIVDMQDLKPISVAEMGQDKKFTQLLGDGELIQNSFGQLINTATYGFVRSSVDNPGGHYIVFTKAIDQIIIDNSDERFKRFEVMTHRLTQKDLEEQEKLALREETKIETNMSVVDNILGLSGS